MIEAARILVVEDNRDTSILLRDLLVAEGYEVESVPTGEAALAALERTPDVDLVVLDLMLPGMSGYEVIEHMRARPTLAATPVLVLSALSSPSARIRGLRDGADDYMTKPFLPEELVARTRTLVTGRLLARRTAEIQALEEIAEAALTVSDPDALLGRILAVVARVFGADAAAILLLDDERRHLRGRVATGLGGDLGRVTMPADAGVAALALRGQAPVVIPEGASDDPRVVNPAIRTGGFHSLMVAPLIVGGIAIGVLEVARRVRLADPRVDRLLRIVADRIAVTMVHARLQAEARELADVVRRINEGVILTDAEDVVLFANRAFAEMVGMSADALRGRRWTELLASAQDVGALTAQIRHSPWQGEVLLITPDGDPRPVRVSISSTPGTE